MRKRDEDDYEVREQHAFERLRTNTPRCGACGENRWQALELHHVGGRAHDDTLVIVCRNCHRVLSDAQRDHPPPQESADPNLEAIGRFLLGFADLLPIIREKLIEFGEWLIAQARRTSGPNA